MVCKLAVKKEDHEYQGCLHGDKIFIVCQHYDHELLLQDFDSFPVIGLFGVFIIEVTPDTTNLCSIENKALSKQAIPADERNDCSKDEKSWKHKTQEPFVVL